MILFNYFLDKLSLFGSHLKAKRIKEKTAAKENVGLYLFLEWTTVTLQLLCIRFSCNLSDSHLTTGFILQATGKSKSMWEKPFNSIKPPKLISVSTIPKWLTAHSYECTNTVVVRLLLCVHECILETFVTSSSCTATHTCT